MINFDLLLEIVVGVLISFGLNYICYWLTEEEHIPTWLAYKPFTCRLCCTTWVSLFTFGIIGLVTSFTYPYLFGFGLVISILNIIALYIDQKQHTIEI